MKLTLLRHGRLIHEQAIVAHKAAIDRRRAFHLLHKKAVLRQEFIKPTVKQVVQPQGSYGGTLCTTGRSCARPAMPGGCAA